MTDQLRNRILRVGTLRLQRPTVLARHTMTLLSAYALAAACSHAQTQARCTIHGDVSLEMVVHWVNTLPDSRIATLIDVCRLGFPLDAAAIDRIGATKASPAVIDALNRATSAGLTLDQAQSQVKGLQSSIDEVDAGVNKDRDAALAKLDVDYQTQRERTGTCKPKDQFETTAQYQARCQAFKDGLTALDSQHQADREKVTSSFAAKAANRDAAYRKRVAYLQAAAYPDLRAIEYENYSATDRQLTANLGNQEYVFDQVAPDTADALFRNWQKVRITRPFADNDLFTRNLVYNSISITGYSKMAHDAQIVSRNQEAAAEEVREAQELMDQKKYANAQDKYNHALALDPTSQAAKVGLDGAKSAITAEEARTHQEGVAGEWIDSQTTLMWTIYDNRESVNWKAAGAYCQNLRAGDQTDWRLPSIDELKTLYDPRSNRNTAPLSKPESYKDYGKLKYDPPGATWPYHAKETVLLSGPSVWSATEDDSQGINQAKMFFFSTGQVVTVPTDYKRTMRALCVRDTVPRPTGVQAVQEATPRFKPIDVQVFRESLTNCNAGDAEQCEMTGYHYEHGIGVDKDLQAALRYYQTACTLGRRGCASAQVLARKLAWQR